MSSVSNERNVSSSSSSASHESDNDVSEVMSPRQDSSSTTSISTSDVEYKYSADEVAVMMESLTIHDSAGLNDALTALEQTSLRVAASYVPKILQAMSADANWDRETIDRVGAWLQQMMEKVPVSLAAYYGDILEYSIKVDKELDEHGTVAEGIAFHICMLFPDEIPAHLEQDIASFFVRVCEKAETAEKTMNEMNADVVVDKAEDMLMQVALTRAISGAGEISTFLYPMVADRLHDHEDWKRRYAAAEVLSLCGREGDEERTRKVVEVAETFLKDEHPVVRYAAVGAIRVMLCINASLLQKHDTLLQALVATLSDPVAGVAAAAAEAIGECIQSCPEAIPIDYRTHLMSSLVDCLEAHCKLLLDEEKNRMLGQIVKTIGALGGTDAKLFTDCCDKLMQPLKTIVRAPDIDYELFREAKKCLCQMAHSIGQEKIIENGFTAKELTWRLFRRCRQELDDDEKEEEGESEKKEEEPPVAESRPQRIRRPVNRLVVDPTKKSYESK